MQDASGVREALSSTALDKGVLLQVRNAEGATDFVLVKAPTATAEK